MLKFALDLIASDAAEDEAEGVEEENAGLCAA